MVVVQTGVCITRDIMKDVNSKFPKNKCFTEHLMVHRLVKRYS